MRAVVQRVKRAEVRVGGETVGRIDRGLCVLVGVGQGDVETDAAWLAQKLLALRVFEDAEGKMNLSLAQVDGALLLVSQFTLLGDARQGARPGFSAAMAPEPADALYRRVVQLCRDGGAQVAEGRFRADMQLELVNDGPVTLLLDSKKLF
jgi:D-tyrosyl-tRNA(Tyr) deacylase